MQKTIESVDRSFSRNPSHPDHRANNSVFMIMNGTIRNGTPEVVTFVRSQAEAVQTVGWKVTLGVVDNRTSPRGILRNIKRLRKEIAETRPGLVHAQYGSVTAAVANASRGRVPLIISFCGDDLLGTPSSVLKRRLRSGSARLISILAASRASAVIVKSRNLFDALPSWLCSKATVLPNGVDTEFFKPLDRIECRRLLGWPQDQSVVLFNASHGENQHCKNLDLATEAVARVSSFIPYVSLKTMSQNTQEEVRLMLNGADCLLVTSLHEGSPNIVKEAMACNLPVVSVNCGDVAERLSNTYPGAICGYGVVELANALAEILGSPRRSNGREQLQQQGLTASAVANRLVNLYSSLIQ